MPRGDSKNGGGSDTRDKKVARGFQRVVRGHREEEKCGKSRNLWKSRDEVTTASGFRALGSKQALKAMGATVELTEYQPGYRQSKPRAMYLPCEHLKLYSLRVLG